MIDTFGTPTSPQYDFWEYKGNSVTAGQQWYIWRKPAGKSFINISLWGGGGAGGSGVIGAVSTAAGGGGGGSGGFTNVTMPLFLLPDILYISIGYPSTGAGIASYVSIDKNTTSQHILALANGGGVGGNASGATAGTGGTAGAIATITTMPLGWAYSRVLAGATGTAGGTTGAGGNTNRLGGIGVMGGGGGAGLGASGAVGSQGGGWTPITAPTQFPSTIGGVGGSTTTTPPGNGEHGMINFLNGMFFSHGGTGGGSTHGSATGAGLVQSSGGNGNIGSGGGGTGGALTGSTAGVRGNGGSGYCLIYCY